MTRIGSTSQTAQARPSSRQAGSGRPVVILIVILIATLAVNVETTVVNVALPTLSTALNSSTRGLQWIVDAYSLTFAGFVLAGGTVGDRFGRRGTLVTGLTLFAASSVAAALSTSTAQLITARLVMGMSSALIYPTTLAILTATYTDPKRRAGAIGAWGAVAGLGVAIGPVLSGALLREFWWGSVFLALAPTALIAAIAAWLVVPTDRRTKRAHLDWPGLLLSVLTLTALIYTIIEAPTRGWLSAATLTGFGVFAVALVAFVLVERRQVDPLIDVTLFTNPRFSAASGAVMVAFFALFGFIFLITQFMQDLQHLDPLNTGVRILPVALSIAVGSVLGTRLAVTRVGTKAVVVAGLLMLAAAFVWASTLGVGVHYPVVAGQMLLLGGGLGLTTAPATESIMGTVRVEQAGAGSAVNDATRQIGGTLGVAVLGSVYSSLYVRHLHASGAFAAVPRPVRAVADQGLAQGLSVAAHAPAQSAAALHTSVSNAFLAGTHAGCLIAAVMCVLGAGFAAALLPAHPRLAPNR